MNIVVVGAGGVGGYFGGKLAQAGYDVTFIARGKHLEAIQQNGLQVKSINGGFKVHPKATNTIEEIENPDLIILATKSWQVINIAKQIKTILTEKTMVLPLQNGADNADKLRSVLPHKNILAGLCKIVSKIEAPGVINHFVYEPEIIFGEYDNTQTERTQKIHAIFSRSNIKNKVSNDIHLDIWRKFLFIATVSGIGALTRVPFGEFQHDPSIMQLIRTTAREIKSVANAKEIHLLNEDVERAITMFLSMGPNTTASMQRDIMEGKPSELENFNGYIVKEGKRLGVKTPINTFTYQCLMPQERLARNKR